MSEFKTLVIWIRHFNRMFWRTPIAAFFTFGLPIFMMFILSSVFSGSLDCFSIDNSSDNFVCLNFAEHYVPALATFSAASATYTNLASTVSIYREERFLKRVLGTPLSPRTYIAAAILSSTWFAFLSVTSMMILGVLIFDVEVLFGELYWTAIFFVLGTLIFSILGLALTGFIPSGRAAPAITNATILPLAFISGVFIYEEEFPAWLDILGDIFPLKALNAGVSVSFGPSMLGDKSISGLLILCAWGLFGAIVLYRHFRWLPTVESEKSGRSKSSRTRSGRSHRDGHALNDGDWQNEQQEVGKSV